MKKNAIVQINKAFTPDLAVSAEVLDAFDYVDIKKILHRNFSPRTHLLSERAPEPPKSAHAYLLEGILAPSFPTHQAALINCVAPIPRSSSSSS
eukprot:767594-Hanusia_phi.AAC.6